jgi:hypothetical protein
VPNFSGIAHPAHCRICDLGVGSVGRPVKRRSFGGGIEASVQVVVSKGSSAVPRVWFADSVALCNALGEAALPAHDFGPCALVQEVVD